MRARPTIRRSPRESRTVDGITFSSKAEATRYGELVILQRGGKVRMFLLQPRFELGGATKYTADFEDHWQDGVTTYEDVKGRNAQGTEAWRRFVRNKKQVEARYPIAITVVER